MSNLIFKVLGAASGKKPDVGTVFVDSGDTRSTASSADLRAMPVNQCLDANGNLHLFTYSGIYKCTGDDVNTAQQLTTSAFTPYTVFYHPQTNYYYASTGYAVFHSQNLLQWTLFFTDSSFLHELQRVNDQVFVFFKGASGNSRGNVMYRLSGAFTFTKITLFTDTNYFINQFIATQHNILGITYKSSNNTYYATTERGISFASTDNGVTWNKAFTNWPSFYPVNKIWLEPINRFISFNLLNPEKPTVFYLGTTVDDLNSPVTELTSTINMTSYMDIPYKLEYGACNADGSVIMLACGGYRFILLTTNGGSTWNQISLPTDNTTNIHGILYTGGNTFLVFQETRIVRTDDNGTSWTTVASSINIRNATIATRPNTSAHGDVATILVGARIANTNTIYFSTNKGLTWSSYATPWGSGLGAACWDGSKFVASGTSGGTSTTFWTSTTGTSAGSWGNTSYPVPKPVGASGDYYAEAIFYRDSTYYVFSASSFSESPSSSPLYSSGFNLDTITPIVSTYRSFTTRLLYASYNFAEGSLTSDTVIPYDYNFFTGSVSAISNLNRTVIQSNYPPFYCRVGNPSPNQTASSDSSYTYAFMDAAITTNGVRSAATTIYKNDNLENPTNWSVTSATVPFSFYSVNLIRDDASLTIYARQSDTVRKYDPITSTYTIVASNRAGLSSYSSSSIGFNILNGKLYYYGAVSVGERYDLNTQAKEVFAILGSIVSIAVNPSGGAVYKIAAGSQSRHSSSAGNVYIGYPNANAIDKFSIVQNIQQFSTPSNVVWDSLNSRFYTIIGNDNFYTTGATVAYSSDGVSWTTATPSANLTRYGHIFTHNPNKLIIFPISSGANVVLETTDGINFTNGSSSIQGVYYSMKHPTTGRCVAYGTKIYYSDDLGNTWTQSTAPSATYISMTWSNSINKYLAFDSSQNLYSSTDAITWSLQATSSALGLSSFIWINTMVETSDSVLVIGAGAGAAGIKYTKDFTFTTPFLNPTVPLGISSSSSMTGVYRSIFDYYLPEGTNEKIKIFGGPNVIAVTP